MVTSNLGCERQEREPPIWVSKGVFRHSLDSGVQVNWTTVFKLNDLHSIPGGSVGK